MTTDLVMPMAALALWTLNILTYAELARLYGIWTGRVQLEDFRYGDSPRVPPDLIVANRNYINLLESPVLFYVACLAAIATSRADLWMSRLAWAFVAARIAHSLIHLANGAFIPRIVAFVASLLILAMMWAKLALGL